MSNDEWVGVILFVWVVLSLGLGYWLAVAMDPIAGFHQLVTWGLMSAASALMILFIMLLGVVFKS